MKKLIAVLALCCGTAHAEFLSGNDLLSQLDGDTYSEKAFSLGYIAGVADGMNDILICAPATATTGQLKDIVWKYLRANPQNRHHSASSLVVESLRKVWPCKRGSGS